MLLRSLVLTFVLVATGCDDKGLNNDLIGTRWALEEAMLPPGDTAMISPTSITFTSDTEVEIESCNACRGAVVRFSNELDFSGLSCTEVACPGLLDLGPRLGAADRVVYSLSDDGLLLIADRDSTLSTFRFEAKAD